ncbi:MAG: flagellar export protein FliJ [Thiohalomonadales bacterium]
MRKSERMRPVLQIALHRERKAAMDLGAARNDLGIKVLRLEELVTYRTEYLQKFSQDGRNVMSADRMQGFRVFLDNLAKAITEQKQIIFSSEQLVAQKFTNWQGMRTKLKMLDSVTARFRETEGQLDEKIAQKEIDELGLGLHRATRNK